MLNNTRKTPFYIGVCPQHCNCGLIQK